MTKEKSKIENVYIWHSGMVMAFGNDGKLLEEYQGVLYNVQSKIYYDSDENTKFFLGKWEKDIIPITKENFYDLTLEIKSNL